MSLSYDGAGRWTCEVEVTTTSMTRGGAGLALASTEIGTPSVRMTLQGLTMESAQAMAACGALRLTIEEVCDEECDDVR